MKVYYIYKQSTNEYLNSSKEFNREFKQVFFHVPWVEYEEQNPDFKLDTLTGLPSKSFNDIIIIEKTLG